MYAPTNTLREESKSEIGVFGGYELAVVARKMSGWWVECSFAGQQAARSPTENGITMGECQDGWHFTSISGLLI